jgi:hypothetical protein
VAELRSLAVLTLSYATLENPTSVAPPFDVMTLDKLGNVKWSVHDFPNEIHASFDDRGKRLM